MTERTRPGSRRGRSRFFLEGFGPGEATQRAWGTSALLSVPYAFISSEAHLSCRSTATCETFLVTDSVSIRRLC